MHLIILLANTASIHLIILLANTAFGFFVPSPCFNDTQSLVSTPQSMPIVRVLHPGLHPVRSPRQYTDRIKY